MKLLPIGLERQERTKWRNCGVLSPQFWGCGIKVQLKMQVRPLIALPVAEKETVPKKEKPRVDMTEEEVKNSTWGEPEEIKSYSDNEEEWVYTENKYIWFEDGIVVRIVDKKDPKIGMTPEEVEESTWGLPESIRTTETTKGTTGIVGISRREVYSF